MYKIRSGLDLGRTVSFKHDGDFSIEVLERFEDTETENLRDTEINFSVEGSGKSCEQQPHPRSRRCYFCHQK